MLKVYRHILIEKRMEREMNAFAKTDVGIERAVNQDYVYAKLDSIGCLPNLFVVADGMGGHKAGDMASRYTVDTLVELLKESDGKDPLDAVNNNIKLVNTLLLRKAGESEEYEGMGTTLVVASVFGDTLRVANVGDSRLYVIGDDITQITRDHSLVEEMVQLGQIDRKEARTHEKKNYITRAIGGCETVEAEMFSVDLKDNDIILMCSDGLTNMLEDSEIFHIIKESPDIKEAAESIGMEPVMFAGFLDGANTSLKQEVDLSTLEDTDSVEIVFDTEKLYYNMLSAKAKWLYTLPEWDGVLSAEQRDTILRQWRADHTAVSHKVGRNDPCPCGSGKKYKNCCG